MQWAELLGSSRKPGTIRLRRLKIDALVRTSCRHIKLAVASGFPSQPAFSSPISGSPGPPSDPAVIRSAPAPPATGPHILGVPRGRWAAPLSSPRPGTAAARPAPAPRRHKREGDRRLAVGVLAKASRGATPTECPPFPGSAVSSTTSHASGPPVGLPRNSASSGPAPRPPAATKWCRPSWLGKPSRSAMIGSADHPFRGAGRVLQPGLERREPTPPFRPSAPATATSSRLGGRTRPRSTGSGRRAEVVLAGSTSNANRISAGAVPGMWVSVRCITAPAPPQHTPPADPSAAAAGAAPPGGAGCDPRR